MEQQIPIEEKKSFLRDDRKLVCSMFLIYGLCICGLVGAAIQGVRTASAHATSTAVVVATEQAKVTATAIARRVEQAKYLYTDRFDNNRKDWYVGSEDDEYWVGHIAIQDGVYVWSAKEVKQGFVYWSEFPVSKSFHDFDVYVDTKVAQGASGYLCGGMIFRETYDEDSEENNYYYYSLCNDSTANISYHSGKDDWESIVSVPYHFSSKEWKRLEISARGSHFIFSIDGNVVYEMDDDRQKTGWVALVIDIGDHGSGSILFDNFGYQPR